MARKSKAAPDRPRQTPEPSPTKDGLSRRELLAAGAGVASAAALAGTGCTSSATPTPTPSRPARASKELPQIDHVVCVMLENRSFDNLAGWLYSPDDPPKHVLPSGGDGPPFHGLAFGNVSNPWNVDDPSQGSLPAVRGTSEWPKKHGKVEPYRVPDPDPHEGFTDITFQLFGANRDPKPGDAPSMDGFLQNYATKARKETAGQIMECYSPEQVPVLSEIARNFAISDHWFASVPCQTTPNRGFVHTGSSDGYVNNGFYGFYDIETIYNVLLQQGISWGVYADSHLPPLTLTHFPKLWDHSDHFHSFKRFQDLASGSGGAKLPSYAFIEPRFKPEPSPHGIAWPNDYHPPWNACRGEHFLAQVYDAVRSSPYRDKILLIITFDEHGGCFDHMPPPWGAVAPEPRPVSRKHDFHFDRFGARIVTILVSSYIEAGTVFRSPTATPYDHTSILATLRDWKAMDQDPKHAFLPSPRIAHAPTVGNVLTLAEPDKRADWPKIEATCKPADSDTSPDMLANDLHLAQLVQAKGYQAGKHIGPEATAKLQREVRTVGDLVKHLKKSS